MRFNQMQYQSVRIAVSLLFLFGCARVNLTSKDPIKLDVTMRVDIYQHVAQDANAIEDMISAPAGNKTVSSDKTSWLVLGVSEAFAQEEGAFPAPVQAAIDARKSRRPELVSRESDGVVGENARGYVEIRDRAAADSATEALVSDENKDRRVIYDHVAQKNNTDSAETGVVFAERIQKDAVSGTPVQDPSGTWMIK